MGKPAARATDTAMTCNDPADLPVGKVIAVGTVMINNLPAAKKGDQIIGVDTHIIMIPTPGGPVPTPLPHPFMGMIDNGVSTTVKIMGQPAAVVTSEASAIPPHIPQGGPFQKPPMNKGKIIMGSANVFIGDGGGGGGGGAGGSGGGEDAVSQAAAGEPQEGHVLDVKFVDKGGKEVTGASYTIKTPDNQQIEGTLVGRIEQKGVKEGDHEIKLRAITDARWSTDEAKVGDKVKITAKTVGFADGESVSLQIFVKDANFADHLFETIEAEVNSDKVEEEWELQVDEKLLEHQDNKAGQNRYSVPYYYFMVLVGGLKQKSGLLRYKDWMELELKDEDDEPIADAEYKVFLPNGEIRSGKLDSNGYAKVEKIPPGRVSVSYDVRKDDD